MADAETKGVVAAIVVMGFFAAVAIAQEFHDLLRGRVR